MASETSDRWSSISKTVFVGFCLIVATLVIYEHRLHVLGYLPFLLLLACPLMHVFMHHGHSHGNDDHPNGGENKGGQDHAWRNAREHRLATTGPYAFVRHPQYGAFMLIMVGFLFQWPTLVTLAMFPILAWFYVRLGRREETAAEADFGETWRVYARSVPGFLPRLGSPAEAKPG
jgi:hypothetical protein